MTLQFKNASTSWDGKQLKSHIMLDDDTAIMITIYYRVQYQNFEKFISMVLHTSKMRRDGEVWVGGMGEFHTVRDGMKRMTMKDLEAYAATLDEATILALTNHEAKPTLIVGREE